MDNHSFFKNVIMLDRDEDWMFIINPSSKEAAVKSCEDFFGAWGNVPGSRVTDVCCCFYGKNCMFPTDVTTWVGSKFPLKVDHGYEVDYTRIFGRLSLEGMYRAYHDYGIDPLQIFVDTLRKQGIRPWLTMRMNDAHDLYNDDVTFCKEELFYQELAAGHMIGDKYGYHGREYDFAYPAIRNMQLALIKEALERYDVDGFDMDFLREPFCFDYKNNPDRHRIMTEYIRNVRAITNEIGKKRGKEIKVMIRLPHTPAESYAYGFDVETICRENLVDAVEPDARWECVNSSIDVDLWRAYVGPDVAIVPGVETLSLRGKNTTEGSAEYGQNVFSFCSAEQVIAYGAAWMAEGADGLYLANMNYPGLSRNPKLWTTDLTAINDLERRFIVTFQDIPSGLVPNPYRPLPMMVNGKADLPLRIGPVSPTQKALLRIDFEGDTAPEILVNGISFGQAQPADPVRNVMESNTEDTVLMTTHASLACDLTGLETTNDVTVTFKGNGTVHYVEIKIN